MWYGIHGSQWARLETLCQVLDAENLYKDERRNTGIEVVVLQWLTNLFNKQYVDETHILFNQQEYLMNLFENYVDNGLNFARKKCVQAMQQVLFYILLTTL